MIHNAEELVWANVFHDAIRGSVWLSPATLSLCPGRWAVGYPYLYVMFRILDEIHPKNILELGLGQSSKMMGRYAASETNCKYTIIEHDETFVSFFRKRNVLPQNASIRILELEKHPFIRNGKKCDVYQYNEKQFDDVLNQSNIP